MKSHQQREVLFSPFGFHLDPKATGDPSTLSLKLIWLFFKQHG